MSELWRELRDDLVALSWRLPWVTPPQRMGAFVRYFGTRTPEGRAKMLWQVHSRLRRVARLGGLHMYAWIAVEHEPVEGTRDPWNAIGSVGWKVRVRR